MPLHTLILYATVVMEHYNNSSDMITGYIATCENAN